MINIEFTITHEVGLHARPAAVFVKMAASYPCEIKVRNLTTQGPFVNAKSILSVLTLGVSQGHRIAIEAIGDQADEALGALGTLIENNFGEVAA